MTQEQLFAIQNLLRELESRKDVKEFDVMYNPLLPKQIMVRYKTHFITEDGGVSFDVVYACFDRQGDKGDCQEMFGDSFYSVMRDYTVIKLDNPSIQIL